MVFVLFSIVILAISSLVSTLFDDESKKAVIACIGTSLGSLVGLFSILPVKYLSDGITIPTNISLISFSFGLDALSQFFLIVIFLISLLVGLYGLGYIKEQRKFIRTSPFFPLLTASMSAVVISRDGFSFLICWEIMSLVSFFLVTSEHENKDVQKAGWIYLIATHLATSFLMVFFVIMAKTSGSLLFSDFVSNHSYSPFLAGLLFIFALVGFGTKAGIFPLHIWLPHAHPAAPSYISAIMSGVMIKTGIYGILRTLTFLGSPPLWWGTLLVIIGVLSAVLGVLYALMQHDLKRLLAYHSVENIGIIVTGIGVGLLGISSGNAVVTVLGLGGALFHVLNHAIFKGLLFLCAGSVAHAVHSLIIDRLGGLLKKIPVTGVTFLIASLAICGLPPFNGFISEWLIYVGLFKGAQSFYGYPVLLSAAGILGIAFAGGLAVACFTKVFGVVFLGEARNEISEKCHEPSCLLLVPMIFLAILCLSIGLYPLPVWTMLLSAVQTIFPNLHIIETGWILSSLRFIGILFAVVLVFIALLLFVRRLIFRTRPIDKTVTWDCGYAYPTVRMQYTASSFAEPIGAFFKPVLKPLINFDKLGGVFPKPQKFEEHIYDIAEKSIFDPMFKYIRVVLLSIKKRKKSTIQSYLSLIFITLIILFVLEVWFGI